MTEVGEGKKMSVVIKELEGVLQERYQSKSENSYSAKVLSNGELLQRKIMEEAFETCLELGRPVIDRQRLTSEAADLVFHLLLGLVASGVSFEDVTGELEQRRRQS